MRRPSGMPYAAWLLKLRRLGLWNPDRPRVPGDRNLLGSILTCDSRYRGPHRLDVTRLVNHIFAPSYGIFVQLYTGAMSWARYRRLYLDEMTESWARYRDQWLEVLHRRCVVLCCWCRRPERCHRSVLAELLVDVGGQVGLPAIYCGETNRWGM